MISQKLNNVHSFQLLKMLKMSRKPLAKKIKNSKKLKNMLGFFGSLIDCMSPGSKVKSGTPKLKRAETDLILKAVSQERLQTNDENERELFGSGHERVSVRGTHVKIGSDIFAFSPFSHQDQRAIQEHTQHIHSHMRKSSNFPIPIGFTCAAADGERENYLSPEPFTHNLQPKCSSDGMEALRKDENHSESRESFTEHGFTPLSSMEFQSSLSIPESVTMNLDKSKRPENTKSLAESVLTFQHYLILEKALESSLDFQLGKPSSSIEKLLEREALEVAFEMSSFSQVSSSFENFGDFDPILPEIP